jgi:proteasome lid subunit RPN8/RPN11
VSWEESLLTRRCPACGSYDPTDPIRYWSPPVSGTDGRCGDPFHLFPFAAEMIEHARRELPNECCGLIVADAGSPVGIFPMVNADASPSTYRMDPAAQLEAFESMDEHGWELWAIYHSHVRTPAWPSEADLARASYPTRYIIVSLADLSWPVLRSFWLEGGEIAADG